MRRLRNLLPFQSTPPLKRGGDKTTAISTVAFCMFQSTPPLKRGGDGQLVNRHPVEIYSFNPLHPSKGVETSFSSKRRFRPPLFQSTPPLKRGGDPVAYRKRFRVVTFQSTPPLKRGGDVKNIVISIIYKMFQSTPPLKRGGDYHTRRENRPGVTVSIHSTPQKGWRLHGGGYNVFCLVVSIHSTPQKGWRLFPDLWRNLNA